MSAVQAKPELITSMHSNQVLELLPTLPYNTLRYSTVHFTLTVHYGTVYTSTVQQMWLFTSTVQIDVQFCTVLYYALLYCTAVTVLFCTIL